MIRIATASFALALTLTATSAGAAPTRSPFFDSSVTRETELTLDSWNTAEVIERKRTFGRKFAIFHAEPQEIAPHAVLIFQVESGGEVRWSCVAVDDVAECLGSPVRIAYQKENETVRLTVKAIQRDTRTGKDLVREVKEARDVKLFARG